MTKRQLNAEIIRRKESECSIPKVLLYKIINFTLVNGKSKD